MIVIGPEVQVLSVNVTLVRWCALVAVGEEDPAALHRLARGCGLSFTLFDDGSAVEIEGSVVRGVPHYNVPSTYRQRAVDAGAVPYEDITDNDLRARAARLLDLSQPVAKLFYAMGKRAGVVP